MIEQKLIVDRYINLAVANALPPAHNKGDFVTMPAQPFYLQESHGVFKKTSGIQGGGGPKAHRNFVWLPWVPGAISETPLAAADVLTGPMSGCWLVTYRRAGVRYAGHLGTDVGKEADNALVNGNWNQFATQHPGDVVGGFNPFRHWNGAFPARKANEPAAPPKIFGLFTTANQYYILVAYLQANSNTLLRVAGLQLVPTAGLARLQQVDLPGP